MRKIENWELKEYTSKKCVDLGWFLPCYFCSYYNRKQEKCMCNTSPFFEKTVKYDEVNITKCPFFEMADGLIRDKNGRIRPDFNEYLKRQGPIIISTTGLHTIEYPCLLASIAVAAEI